MGDLSVELFDLLVVIRRFSLVKGVPQFHALPQQIFQLAPESSRRATLGFQHFVQILLRCDPKGRTRLTKRAGPGGDSESFAVKKRRRASLSKPVVDGAQAREEPLFEIGRASC